TAGKLNSLPGSPSSFSTSTTSPTATLYCLPPVLTIAYADTDAPGCSMVNGACVLNRAVRGRHRRQPALAAGRCIGYVVLLDGRAPGSADLFLWWACRARRRSPSTPWCGPGHRGDHFGPTRRPCRRGVHRLDHGRRLRHRRTRRPGHRELLGRLPHSGSPQRRRAGLARLSLGRLLSGIGGRLTARTRGERTLALSTCRRCGLPTGRRLVTRARSGRGLVAFRRPVGTRARRPSGFLAVLPARRGRILCLGGRFGC